jgi:LmbE family N-acetylglucosaminyl deacetylase
MTALDPCLKAAEALRRMRALPFAPLDRIAPGTSLIVAPHPDDETLGCGGLIAACCAAGRPPVVVCVTDGAASHPGSLTHPPAKLAALREDELRAACGILGLAPDRIHFLRQPDAQAPQSGAGFDAAVQAIVALSHAHDVTTIFATWPHDPHCDHRAAADMAEAAAATAGARLKFYPVWGWLLPGTERVAVSAIHGARLDVAAALAAKRCAIAAHKSQYTDLIRDSPNGFRLPDALLTVFDQPYEVFLEP